MLVWARTAKLLSEGLMSWWYGNESKCGALLVLVSACSSHTAAESAQTPAPPASAAAPLAVSAAPSANASPPPVLDAGAAPVGSAAPPRDGSTAAASAGKMCGGIAGIRCPEQQYCAFPLEAKCGAGDMSGVCKPIPGMCTMEYAPVCGCDAKTYGSSCVAARASVSVAKRGACETEGASNGVIPDGKICGTRGVSGSCADGSYCAFKTACGNLDGGGTCTKKPQICNHLMAPVCGCDGKTYPNGCHAAREGVSVSAQGACKN